MRLLLGLSAAITLALAAAPPPASAAVENDSPDAMVIPVDFPRKPDHFSITARAALETANQTPEVMQQRSRRGTLRAGIEEANVAWEVSYYDDQDEGKKVALVIIDGPTGEVREAWTGLQVGWPSARGYEGWFGHSLNSPWIWLPLSALFLFGLANWRSPGRIAHLDLLVLLAFGLSYAIFSAGDVGVSFPLVYPPLLYLLGRMAWIGFGRRSAPLRPSAPTSFFVIAAIALVICRIVLQVADSGVSDVGYAGVIGADRISRGDAVWGEGAFPEDNPVGDAYGPTVYLAYLPFQQAIGWSGVWDDLPAARWASVTFDLLALLGLLYLGKALCRPREEEGLPWLERNRLGVVLAFAWLAFPFTDLALQSSTNDALLAAGVIWALALFARPGVRGALLAATALTKFAPLVLVPLFVAGRRALPRPDLRDPALAALGLAIVSVALLAWPAISPGLGVFWERTIVTQAERGSIFSVWGQAELGPARQIVWVLVALFAASLAFAPRGRSLAQVCALSGAALIAVQLTIEHWFYFYIPWFLGPVLAAICASSDRSARGSARSG